MLAKYLSIIRNYVLSVFVQRKYTFYHKTRFSMLSERILVNYWQESFDGDSFVSQSRFDAYVVGRNLSMVISLLADQDLTPMLYTLLSTGKPQYS